MSVKLGDLDLSGMRLGENEILVAYLGEIEVYTTGPFEGLRVTKRKKTTIKGGTFTIKGQSSELWSATTPEWITLSQTSGDAGKFEIEATIAETDDSREASIDFTTENYSASCIVYQEKDLQPTNEIWYKTTDNKPVTTFRSSEQGSTWWGGNYVIDNYYDAELGYCRMVWADDFVKTAGSGFLYRSTLTEVILPKSFEYDCENNWKETLNLKKIVYKGLNRLDKNVFDTGSKVNEIYNYSPTAPAFVSSNPFYGMGAQGEYHYPSGADHSTVAAALPSGWTMIDDL